MPTLRYGIKYNSVAASVGRFGWKIVDNEDEQRVMAQTDNKNDADLICNALNFNNIPGSYGYKLVEDE